MRLLQPYFLRDPPASCLQIISSLCYCFLSASCSLGTPRPPLAEVHQDRLCRVRIMDPVECTKRKGNMTFYNGACQKCVDLCKRQLCTDPVTKSPPPSLSPEPLGLGKGRDNPPSPRVPWGFPNGVSWQEQLTSGKALSICQRVGSLHSFAWIPSSPGKEEHWELVVGVAGKGAWISS